MKGEMSLVAESAEDSAAPARNDRVGGSLTSRHQWGDAADGRPSDYNGQGLVNSQDRDRR